MSTLSAPPICPPTDLQVPLNNTASPHALVEWPIPGPAHHRLEGPSNHNTPVRHGIMCTCPGL
jgi:hypothetical protein